MKLLIKYVHDKRIEDMTGKKPFFNPFPYFGMQRYCVGGFLELCDCIVMRINKG